MLYEMYPIKHAQGVVMFGFVAITLAMHVILVYWGRDKVAAIL